jgi:hypothetical protein
MIITTRLFRARTETEVWPLATVAELVGQPISFRLGTHRYPASILDARIEGGWVTADVDLPDEAAASFAVW